MQRTKKWKITQIYRDNIQKTTAPGYFAIRDTPLPFPGEFETYFIFKNNFLAFQNCLAFLKFVDFLGVIVV